MEYILYHGDCDDGFGAAWTAWKALGSQATYLPVHHSEPPPEIPDGSKVTLVDFAYPRDIMLGLDARMDSLKVLDHHITAEHDLAGLDFVHIDLSKSGATLAWEHWFPDEPVPPLIQYIQDKDLWQFQLDNSAEVTAALQSYPRDFEVWNTLSVDDLAKEGVAIQRAIDIKVGEHVEMAAFREVGGYLVPVVNASCYTSQIGDQLNARYPDAPFSAMYVDHPDGKRRWSLRSRGEFDVSKVAEQFGGGGHRNAAGFIEGPE